VVVVFVTWIVVVVVVVVTAGGAVVVVLSAVTGTSTVVEVGSGSASTDVVGVETHTAYSVRSAPNAYKAESAYSTVPVGDVLHPAKVCSLLVKVFGERVEAVSDV
jgi:hypothetical protein